MTTINSQPTTYKTLIIVLLAGLALNIAVLCSIREVTILYDEVDYNNLAKNIIAGKGFCHEEGNPTSIRPPLYPVFLAGVYILSDIDNYRAVWLSQILLHLATGLLVYQLGKILFSPRVGLLACGLYVCYPSLIGFNFLLMSEILFNFLFTLSILLFASFLKNEKKYFLVLAGVAFGLATLTRTVAWPLAGVLALFLIIFRSWNKENLKKGVLSCFVLLFFFGLTISPWAWRNTQVQGSFTMIDTMGGMNLMMGNYAHTPLNRAWAAVELKGKESWAYELQVTGQGRHMSENDKQKWASRKAIEFMLDHPLLTLKRSLVKILDFWGQERVIIASLLEGHWGTPAKSIVIILAGSIFSFYTVLFLTSVLGWGYAYGKMRLISVFFGLLYVGLTLIHALVFGHSRYHMPMIPVMAVLAALTIENRKLPRGYFTEHRVLGFICAGWILFVTAGWIRTIAFVDFDKISKIL